MLSNPVHRKSSTPQESAEAMAGDILGFLAADEERLMRFFALSGLDAGSLRQASQSKGFSESLLDYLTADEPLLIAFATETGDQPAKIEALRMSLTAVDDDV